MLPPIWQAISKSESNRLYDLWIPLWLLGTTDVPILVSVLILVLFIIVLYGICWKLIEKGRGLRS